MKLSSLAFLTVSLGLLSACSVDNPPARPGAPSSEGVNSKTAITFALHPPTNVQANRKPPQVEITWNGPTTDYDLAQSFRNATGEWSKPTVSKLRPATHATSGYYKSVTALPQPMAFCLRSVNGKSRSDWTSWVISNP